MRCLSIERETRAVLSEPTVRRRRHEVKSSALFCVLCSRFWHDGVHARHPHPTPASPRADAGGHHPDRPAPPRHRRSRCPVRARRGPRPRRRLLGDLPLRAQSRRPADPAGRRRVRRARRRGGRSRGEGRHRGLPRPVPGDRARRARLGAAGTGDLRAALRQPRPRLPGPCRAHDRSRHPRHHGAGAALGRRPPGGSGPGPRDDATGLAGPGRRREADQGRVRARRARTTSSCAACSAGRRCSAASASRCSGSTAPTPSARSTTSSSTSCSCWPTRRGCRAP